MRELQNVGYRIKKSQVALIIAIFVLLISIVVVVIYDKSKKSDIVETSLQKSSENLHEEELEIEKETLKSTMATTKIEENNEMAILITLEEGELYAISNNNTQNSGVYYYDSNTYNNLYNKNGVISDALSLGESIEPNMVDISNGVITIALSDIEIKLEATETNIFLKRLGEVLNDERYCFSEKWEELYTKLNNKKEQLDNIAGVDLVELPDTYPAAYSHANLSIFNVDKETFNDYDKATDFARTNLSAMAKEHNISGYFIGEGLLNNGNIRYLIYWIK